MSALVMLSVPFLFAAAKSGHGGTTQVIGRIEMPSDSQGGESSPGSSMPSSASSDEDQSSDSSIVDTGDHFPFLITAAAVISLGLIGAVGLKTDKPDKTE